METEAKEDSANDQHQFHHKTLSSILKKNAKPILLNKNIWKYIAVYCLVYFGSRKLFDAWYKSPKYASNVSLSSIDKSTHMLEGVIGKNDSHKPSSNVALMTAQIIQNLLFWFKAKPSWKYYAFPTYKQLEESVHPNYKNKDCFRYITDLQISIWSFLLVIDAYDCIKQGKFNKTDRIMALHHFMTLAQCVISRSEQNWGLYLTWQMLWGESIAILATMASLFRVIYQKKRRDLIILKNISDVLFALHAIAFTYARLYLFPFLGAPIGFKYGIFNKHNQ
eukprot:510460_1